MFVYIYYVLVLILCVHMNNLLSCRNNTNF